MKGSSMKKGLMIALCLVMMLGTCLTTAQAAEVDETEQTAADEIGSVEFDPELDTKDITEIRYAGDNGCYIRLSPIKQADSVGRLKKDVVLYIIDVVELNENGMDFVWVKAKVCDDGVYYYIPFEQTKTESEVGSGYKEHTVSVSNVSSKSGKSAEMSSAPFGENGGLFTITTYCPCAVCNGGYTGTAIGTSVTPGRTIAVDPSVIPLGTTVYIEGVGTRIAEDTGGAIKGNKIDLAVGSHGEFGKWTAHVTW